MARTINPDDLSQAISDLFQDYTNDTDRKLDEAVDQCAKEVNKEIIAHVAFKQPTGKYVKAFRLKTLEQRQHCKTKVWYVKGAEYRLTHLLERGHMNADGSRTRAYPHIRYGWRLAEKRMMELAKKAVQP